MWNLKALLVECIAPQTKPRMNEVKDIAKTAGYDVVGQVTQHRDAIDSAYCVGEGKLDEIGKTLERESIEVVIFTRPLSPGQIFRIKKKLGDEVRVPDRNLLILEVFEKRSGKTTLFNRLAPESKETGTGPFTTLSTFAREIHTTSNRKSGHQFIMIDSIGFIEDLNPLLLNAFHTTLNELANSDLVLLFVDASDDIETVIRKNSLAKGIQ